MKQGRKPFREEKILMAEKNLLWKDWEVIEANNKFFRIRNKWHGNIKTIWK